MNVPLASKQDDISPQLTPSAKIIAINGTTGTIPVKSGDVVTLTVSNIQLDRVAPSTLKALVGSKEADLPDPLPVKEGAHEYTVKIRVPPQPSGDQGNGYRPFLLVGTQRVQGKPSLLLKYQ